MVLWETEFYALSFVTGKLQSFRGTFILAESFQDALGIIRDNGMEHLQLNGKNYKDFDAIFRADEFYEQLEEPIELIKGMEYDDFMDWVEKAPEKSDLEEALEKFKKEEGMDDYVKILETYLKNYDKKDSEESKGESS